MSQPFHFVGQISTQYTILYSCNGKNPTLFDTSLTYPCELFSFGLLTLTGILQYEL